jgi:uncharacterized membrane protein YeaQ/YmgE (transglycosylase-associated protein family)
MRRELPVPARNRSAPAAFSQRIGKDPVMGIIGTIVIGFLAGLVAKFLHPGRDPAGFIITTLLGIVGAVVATYLGQAVGWYRAGEGAGFIGAVVGAIIVLFIYNMVTRRSTSSL